MRLLVLSALFALGVGVAGSTAASAGTLGSGINNAAKASTLLEETAYGCRRVRVCRRGAYGVVRCHWNRVCRRY